MQARAKWVNGHRFLGNTGNGHGVIMDGSGSDDPLGRIGPSPMELLLLGMAGCTGIDVIHILEKSRQPVTDCVVEIDGTRADTEPKVFTHIHAIFTVTGKGLDPAKVERAVQLSAEKYCSASLMLGKTAEITRELHIVEEDEA